MSDLKWFMTYTIVRPGVTQITAIKPKQPADPTARPAKSALKTFPPNSLLTPPATPDKTPVIASNSVRPSSELDGIRQRGAKDADTTERRRRSCCLIVDMQPGSKTFPEENMVAVGMDDSENKEAKRKRKRSLSPSVLRADRTSDVKRIRHRTPTPISYNVRTEEGVPDIVLTCEDADELAQPAPVSVAAHVDPSHLSVAEDRNFAEFETAPKAWIPEEVEPKNNSGLVQAFNLLRTEDSRMSSESCPWITLEDGPASLS